MNRRRYFTYDERLSISWVVGIVSWLLIFVGVFLWSFAVWNDHIYKAKHNKNFRVHTALVQQETTLIDKDTKVVEVSYSNYYDYPQTVAVEVSKSVKVGDILKVDVGVKGHDYIPKALDNQVDDPFKAYSDSNGGWFPGGNIALVGVVANTILSALIGYILFIALEDAAVPRLRRRHETLYGMKQKEKPKRYKLVHTASGQLVEKEFRE